MSVLAENEILSFKGFMILISLFFYLYGVNDLLALGEAKFSASNSVTILSCGER